MTARTEITASIACAATPARSASRSRAIGEPAPTKRPRSRRCIEAWRPHYSIHLGDVYYVGDPAEVGANFLGIPNPRYQFAPCKWPLGSEGAFALNGNHEMYALGYGYFDHILPKLGVRGSPHGQRASYFCLENDHWRIIALDTSYNSVGAPILEHFLEPDCALPAELDRMAARGR